MLPLPRFGLHRPTTIDEAVELLARIEGAKLLAGGTDLVPNMKQGLAEPPALISLGRVPALRGIRIEGDALRIGAMTTLDAIAADQRIPRVLAEAAQAVGGPHHRKMGTLGGNLNLDTRCRYYNQTHFWRQALGFCLKKDGTVCHVVAGGQKCVAAASNDTAPALLSLGAEVVLRGEGGVRTMALGDYYTADGIQNTVRGDHEILTEVVVPLVAGRGSAFEKLRRRAAIDFPLLSVAARADLQGKTVRALEVWVSALAAKPRRIEAARKVQAGAACDAKLVASIAEAAKRECKPLDNVEGDSAWRREMVPVLVEKALSRAVAGAG